MRIVNDLHTFFIVENDGEACLTLRVLWCALLDYFLGKKNRPEFCYGPQNKPQKCFLVNLKLTAVCHCAKGKNILKAIQRISRFGIDLSCNKWGSKKSLTFSISLKLT